MHPRGHSGRRGDGPRRARPPRGGRHRRGALRHDRPDRPPARPDDRSLRARRSWTVDRYPVDVLPAGEEAVLVEVADLDDVLALDARPPLGRRIRHRAVALCHGPRARGTDPPRRGWRGDRPRRAGPLGARGGRGCRALPEPGRQRERRTGGGHPRALRRPRPRRRRRHHRPHGGRRGRRPHTDSVACRVLRLRPRVRLPRRWRLAAWRASSGHPRASVPAGSVALAGEFSAVYPRTSPGGWQVIGTTDAVLWDVQRRPPALLDPGTTVRFVDVGSDAVTRALEVLSTGPLVLVEDEGRPGTRRWASGGPGRPTRGVPARSTDRRSRRGPGGARDPARRARGARPGRVTVVVTGAPAPTSLDGRTVADATLVDVTAGSVLTLGMPASGLRSYLTVRGGIDVEPVLGSRSTDTLSLVGPAPSRRGDVLPVGRPGRAFPTVDHVGRAAARPRRCLPARGAARAASGVARRVGR